MTVWIEKIKLVNFRNHIILEQNFDKETNIIVGSNGIGKTSILEGIFFLANKKSYRSIYFENIVNKDKEISYIEGVIKNENISQKITIEINKQKKVN